MDTEKSTTKPSTEAEKKYPGVAIDRADDDRVDPQDVKCETRYLNNNPRNNSIDE